MKQRTLTPDGSVFYGLVDEHGNAIERTPTTHPYSYDGFVTWRLNDETPDSGVYTDRLIQQNRELHNILCQKHFGDKRQYWTDRDPKKVEAFLRDWTGDKELKLIFIMQYCKGYSGYPTWRLDFKYGEEQQENIKKGITL